VGSKADFEDMNRLLEEKKVELSPALDRVFGFEESEKAFEYLLSGKHTGEGCDQGRVVDSVRCTIRNAYHLTRDDEQDPLGSLYQYC
jgi:hypothetical protein